MTKIMLSSTQHPIIKLLRSLHIKKHRKETGLFFAEGTEMLGRARASGWQAEHLLYQQSCPPELAGWTPPIEITARLMKLISAQNNPTSVFATFRQSPLSLPDIVSEHAIWVALEKPRDPGNLGTIMRTMDAINANGLILIGDSCDAYASETVRASMGSLFKMKLVICNSSEFDRFARSWSGDIVATDARAGSKDFRCPYHRPVLLLLGGEKHGLSPEISALAKTCVHIPMPGGTQSLNLAMAATLMLYEITRPTHI